ncbi:uncharacterized protein LOC119070672 [Bradysia coprophila]|uniref:uncharacterized protein LOC119070672 n=1 Tax=Bradysia coprophila TaxID=38358 RepID=UPI00187DAA74|nr:uncharacterized protein LOC119070672 [Bradysia coprophila]
MKAFAIIVILIQMHFALGENPTCAFYDFNDPLILSEFDDCTLAGSHPLRTLSYSDSTFAPFREDSRFFLTTNKSVHSDITQCISTKIPFRGNFSSFSFQIGINMRNNKDIDQYNDVQLFIEDILSFQINANTNDWTLYKKDYTLPSLGSFDNAVIGLKVRIGSNSDLAVEFLKFYDRQITDENCVPHEPESTTVVTEAPTRETEAPTTEAPTTETPTTETPTTEAPTTEAPTTEAPSTEAPTTEVSTTEAPTTEAPTTEAPTPETETPTPEIELPACLKIDFNNATSLFGIFKECHLQYLPELIIKSYVDTTITPYRDTSLFFLSNKWEGYSCLETTSNFPLPEASIVDSVIFLNGAWPGAWIEFSVTDIYTGVREVVKRLEITNNWIRLSEEIKGSYSNAQFMIKTNMNAYSQLAVEYFNIRSGSC